ncbi:SsgA family sporulation/cell division regulator [Streptomyces sp. NPDC050504]|uniref:SsgA family sporulation/cell division regulator n=1 Tax=Streptomyces sp. NPDC050504 TaxID=3365618 RepID=UPI003792EF9E
MSPTVENHARARLITDAPTATAVPVALSYDAANDPRAVRFVFPGGNEWVFARELLEAGMRSPVRRGDIEVWPCGRVQTVLEFHSPDGVAVLQFDSAALVRFLRRTYAVAAPA